jgi:hypothetical protein
MLKSKPTFFSFSQPEGFGGVAIYQMLGRGIKDLKWGLLE